MTTYMPKCPSHIVVIIPTYNNAGTVVDVVERTLQVAHHVMVVVDGSTDDTLVRLESLRHRITIVGLPKNGGKGAALKAGFDKAIELGFEYALTLDADGQHYPEEIPVLVEQLMLHPGSLIVGSRDLREVDIAGKAMFANRFSNFWYCVQTGIRLPDTQTGMRIYPLAKLGHYHWLTSRYESELELLVFSAWRNVPIYPVPIRVFYPPRAERVSHFHPVYDFTRISILNSLLCVLSIVYGYPSRWWRTLYEEVRFFYAATRCRIGHGEIMNRVSRWTKFVMRGPALNPVHYHGEDRGRERPVMYICNHTSMYDVMAILASNSKTMIITQEWVQHNPFFGKVVVQAGFLPITEGLDVLLPKLRSKVEQGYSLLIFPEGTRSKTGDIGRFHRGAFYIAEQLELPIVPILIRGTYEVLGKREFRLGRSPIHITYLPIVERWDSRFGVGYREQAKRYEGYYRALLRTYASTVVIGGGVGGLFTGALLAESGICVMVLEQNHTVGGGMANIHADGREWSTGMHVVSGLGADGPVTRILNRLGIYPSVVPVEPPVVHGEGGDPMAILYGGDDSLEVARIIKASFAKGAYRFAGSAAPLAEALADYITMHGGRVITRAEVTRIIVHDKHVNAVVTADGSTYMADNYVSTINPKMLTQLTTSPVFRPATLKRLLETPDSIRCQKVCFALKPLKFMYLPENHYLMPEDILVLTPSALDQCEYADRLEVIIPIRNNKYTINQLIGRLAEIWPDLPQKIISSFDTERVMYGISEPVGAVTTATDNLYLTGQNCFVHGFMGTVETAVLTVNKITE